MKKESEKKQRKPSLFQVSVGESVKLDSEQLKVEKKVTKNLNCKMKNKKSEKEQMQPTLFLVGFGGSLSLVKRFSKFSSTSVDGEVQRTSRRASP